MVPLTRLFEMRNSCSIDGEKVMEGRGRGDLGSHGELRGGLGRSGEMAHLEHREVSERLGHLPAEGIVVKEDLERRGHPGDLRGDRPLRAGEAPSHR